MTSDLTRRMVAANQRRALGVQGSYAVETVIPEEEKAAPAEPSVGTIPPAEAASYLKRDGSRSLTGNLPVDAGVTIDGVDLSVHAANANAHHARYTDAEAIVAAKTVKLNEFAAPDGAVDFNSQNLTGLGTLGSAAGILTIDETASLSDYLTTARGDSRYYTETELDAGQLDHRYYTETEMDAALALTAPIDAPTFTTSVTIPETAGVADYDKFLVTDSGVIKYRTGAQLLSDIGGQALDATLTAFASLLTAANKIPYATGPDTAAELDLATTVGNPGSDTTLVSEQGIREAIAAVGAHAILDGNIHTDSVADAVTRGSIIYGNATPKWDELVVGAANTFLGSDGTDVSYRTAAQVLASLSGAAGAAFDFNSQNLTSVGTIGCNEITVADGHGINLQEDITFTGATTENQIKFPDALPNALSFQEGANLYQTFITSNGSEAIQFHKKVGFGTPTPATNVHIYSASNAANILSIDITGAGNAETSELNLLSDGTGAIALGHISAKGWALRTHSNAHATVVLRNDLLLTYWSGSAWTNVLYAQYDGNIGAGTLSPLGRFDIAYGGYQTIPALVIGADLGANTSRTNNTRKFGTIGVPHYTNAEEKIELIFVDSDGTNNTIGIGGGNADFNAATVIRFFTGANDTTTSGTEAMRVNSSGDFGVGTNPAYRLDIYDDQASYASLIWNNGNSDAYGGMIVRCGADDGMGTNYTLVAQDGDGNNEGALRIQNGTFELCQLSDNRVKQNIRDTSMKGLDIIKKLQVRDFEFCRLPNIPQCGLIAQELREVYPKAVGDPPIIDEKTGERGWLMTSNIALIPVIIKAIQEENIFLWSEIERLEDLISELK